ncbi:MAG: class I SAM-dependent methyltransferase [Terrimicrobiaceae bacterium]|nr:class I SAM-dependent methyltransferase [Terrimicrobiaceae bacterium]
MAASQPIDEPGQDAAQVKAFFDQWAIYRKVLEFDYLHHRAAYAAIGRALEELPHPFSFLDLGAGDAECTVGALAGKPLTRYEAVDLSAVALRLARKRAEMLPCVKNFVQADFVEHVRASRETFDVVFIGLSFHHLPQAHKRSFLPELRRLVAPGGRLIVYEPIRRAGESREEALARWWEVARATWTALAPDELEKARDHVFGNDYPESVDAYAGLFSEAGFARPRVLFTDPDALYAGFEAGV